MLSQSKLYPKQSEEAIKQIEDKQKDPKTIIPCRNIIHSIYKHLHLSRKNNATHTKLL